jgi:anaerobic magnesium-protoporphyrin IX monomethyl ester cyclase
MMNVLIANMHSRVLEESPSNMRHLQFPTGLAIIAGVVARTRKYSVHVVDDYTSDISESQLADYIDNHRINCILLSSFAGTYQYGYFKRLVNLLSSFRQLQIILGGPLATTCHTVLHRNVSCPDGQIICVVGEGEDTVVDLLESIGGNRSLGRVDGISYKESGQVVTTKPRKRITLLALENFPMYEVFEMQKYVDYVKSTNRCWEISASRGCYNKCRYCKTVFGAKISFYSPAGIVLEMERISRRYGIFKFNFVDDNFLNSDIQFEAFLGGLKKSEEHFSWRFQGRVDKFASHSIERMKELGLWGVSLGIESGSEIILHEMNKLIDLRQARETISRLLENYVQVHGSFIVGMRHESPQTIDDTIQFIHSAGEIFVNAGILTLFPGSELYKEALQAGIIGDEDRYLENLGPVYTKPYTNMTAYADEYLLTWRERIANAGAQTNR